MSTDVDTLEIGAPPSRFRRGMLASIEEAARAIAMEHGGEVSQKECAEAGDDTEGTAMETVISGHGCASDWTMDQHSYNAGYYDGLAKCEGNGISVQQLETLMRAQCRRFGITEFLGLARAVAAIELAIESCLDADDPFDIESEAGSDG